MPLTQPVDSTIAVVGDGFGSLQVYATARYVGFRPEQLTIFGTNDNPVATYQQFAYNLGQTVLRSESESHFLPADWPTFAQLDAWSRRSPTPIVRSVLRRYNPGVREILTQATVVQARLGWNARRYSARVGWLQREEEPQPHFVLYDEDANYIGRAKHVMLAIGHGPLSFPPVLAEARKDPGLADRVVQAYEPKAYARGGRYVVVGAGIASVNEWVLGLDSGASMISLLRSPDPADQDLNAPRCLFEARGIDIFAGMPFERRLQFLGQILKGSSPRRRGWERKIIAGRAQGRFDELFGEIDHVEPGPAGLRIHVRSSRGPDVGWLDVTGVVAGTGFNKSALTVPLFRRLVEHYSIPVEEGRLRLLTNCGLPVLDRPESRLCVMGIHANTVIPHGDTIAGLKYVARRFVADCARAERIRPTGLLSRLRLQLGLGGDTAAALRHVRRTQQVT